jgi:hypothetical protein
MQINNFMARDIKVAKPKIMTHDADGNVRISDLPEMDRRLSVGDVFRVNGIEGIFRVVPDDYAKKA